MKRVLHLLITKYILKQEWICNSLNVNTCIWHLIHFSLCTCAVNFAVFRIVGCCWLPCSCLILPLPPHGVTPLPVCCLHFPESLWMLLYTSHRRERLPSCNASCAVSFVECSVGQTELNLLNRLVDFFSCGRGEGIGQGRTYNMPLL